MPNCRHCQQPIRFAKVPSIGDRARALPFDQREHTEGSFVLYHEGGVLTARPARLPADQMRPRHRLHFDTCRARRYRKDPQR